MTKTTRCNHEEATHRITVTVLSTGSGHCAWSSAADGGLKVVDCGSVTATPQEHHPRAASSHHDLRGGPQWTVIVVNRAERRRARNTAPPAEVVFHPRMAKSRFILNASRRASRRRPTASKFSASPAASIRRSSTIR